MQRSIQTAHLLLLVLHLVKHACRGCVNMPCLLQITAASVTGFSVSVAFRALLTNFLLQMIQMNRGQVVPGALD